MLQHVVNMRHRGQHDISQLIISGLQSLVVSPSVQAVLSFAQSHLAVSTDPRESAHSYGFRAQQDLNFSNLSRQRTSYSVERSRATVLAALDNVRHPNLDCCWSVVLTTLTTHPRETCTAGVYSSARNPRGACMALCQYSIHNSTCSSCHLYWDRFMGPSWQKFNSKQLIMATKLLLRLPILVGGLCQDARGNCATSMSSPCMLDSLAILVLQATLTTLCLQEECKEPDSFEARLLLLHLEAISGRALVPQVAHAQSLQHVDSAKLAAISGLIPSIGGFKFDTGRRQSTGRKRKRSVSKKRVEPSQDSHSMRPSLQADDLFQVRASAP